MPQESKAAPGAHGRSGIVGNVMTTRAEILQQLFDPRRDINEECGYPNIITCEQYRAMYDRELGQRVVNVYPEETWRQFPAIYEDPNPDKTTAFEEGLDALEKAHHLLHYLQRADELSGVGHYGIILWGLDDGLSLETPVEGWETWAEVTGKPGKLSDVNRHILYIRVLDESLVRIADYETDQSSPRYGLPTSYMISLVDPRNQEGRATTSPPGITEARVHWTRVTHIADNRKTSEVLGTPRMQSVWNRLYDLRKVLGGSGEMFWRGGFPGISLETQPGLENAELDEDATRTMMYNYMNGLQRYLSLIGMNAKSLAPQIADPTSSFEVQVKAICIVLGVPYRVFMGIEEGVVSGDQATKAWQGRLQNRQARYVTPMIIDPVLTRLVEYGVLASPAKPYGWTVEWPPMTEPDEEKQANVAGKKTEAFAKYIAGNVDMLVPPLEFLTLICGLDDRTAQAIITAAAAHAEEVADAHAEEDIEDDGKQTPGQAPEDLEE